MADRPDDRTRTGDPFTRRRFLRGTVLAGVFAGAGVIAGCQGRDARRNQQTNGRWADVVDIGSFETTIEPWTFSASHADRSATASSSLTRVGDAKVGDGAGRLTGSRRGSGAWSVSAARSLDNTRPGQLPAPRISGLRLWLRAANAKAVVLQAVDSSGQTHRQTLRLTSSDWTHFEIDDFASGTQHSHSGGAGDGHWHGHAMSLLLTVPSVQMNDPDKPVTLWIDGVYALQAARNALTVRQSTLGNIVAAGQAARVWAASASGQVKLRVRDLWGNNVTTIEQAHSGSDAASGRQIDLGTTAPGFYTVEMSSTSWTKVEVATAAGIVPASSHAANGAGPFGAQTHFRNDGTVTMPLVESLGVSQVRDEILWRNVETRRNVLKAPAFADDFMSDLKGARISPLMEVSSANDLYDDGQKPYSSSAVEAFARYADSVLTTYGSQIRWLEVWNEYNHPAKAGFNDPAHYLAILKAIHDVVKKNHPKVTIVAPATAGMALPWLEQLFSLGGLNYLDAVSTHPYRYPGPPEGLEKQIGMLRDRVDARSTPGSKQLWLSEIGWPTGNTQAVPERTQAEYLPRAYALALSAGAEKVFWYSLINNDADRSERESNFGLVKSLADPDGRYVPKPAYIAYAVLTRMLDGLSYAGSDAGLPAGVRSLVFGHGSDAVRVMWSPLRRQNVAVLASDLCTVVDLMGRSTTYRPRDGRIGLTLGGDVLYVKGPVSTVKAGYPAQLSVRGAAPGDEVAVEVAVTGSQAGQSPEVALLGDSRRRPLSRSGGAARVRRNVSGLAGPGVRTVIGDLWLGGHRTARLAADVTIR